WESEMYKKTALRRLAKLLPVDIVVDEEPLEEPTPAPAPRQKPRRSEGATAALDAFAAEPEPEPELVDENDSPALIESVNGAAARQAYERGKADKSAGVVRKACPG